MTSQGVVLNCTERPPPAGTSALTFVPTGVILNTMRPVIRQRVERGKQCKHGHADLWAVSGHLLSGKPLYQCVGCSVVRAEAHKAKRREARQAMAKAAAEAIEKKSLGEHLANYRLFVDPASPCPKCQSTHKVRWYGVTHCDPCLRFQSAAYAATMAHRETVA